MRCICGTKQLKKNFKRHMRMHEGPPSERIQFSFKGCQLIFSNSSNLNQHIKVVHLELKPFLCGMSGCNKRFTFKHVRDNHEKFGCHVYTPVRTFTSLRTGSVHKKKMGTEYLGIE